MQETTARRSRPAEKSGEPGDGVEFLRRIRERFVGLERPVPLYGGVWRPYVNFDNAATTPALCDVAEGVSEFLDWYGSVHRGTGVKSLISTRCYDRAREIVADFVGADRDYHTVIITCSATGAINKLARTLGSQGKPLVLCTVMEHHSNLLPWRENCRVDYVEVRPEDCSVDVEDMEAKLARHAGAVRLVAVSGASNVTGLAPPIHRIARIAHAHGAEILVDGAQLVPHRRVRMGRPGDPESIDYLAFSGHKMYAPFGAGALVGPAKTFDNGNPPESVGGGTVKLVTPEPIVWADMPAREEPGTPNVVGAVAMAKAIVVLQELGMDWVAEHDRAIRSRVIQALSSIPGVRIYGEPAPKDHERVGVVGFEAEQINHSLLAAALGYEWGIAVRHGCFCAHLYIMRLLGIEGPALQEYLQQARRDDQSQFPGLVRISLGIYNSPEEVDYLATALRSLLEDGPRARYVMQPSTGEYLPADDSCDLDGCFSL